MLIPAAVPARRADTEHIPGFQLHHPLARQGDLLFPSYQDILTTLPATAMPTATTPAPSATPTETPSSTTP